MNNDTTVDYSSGYKNLENSVENGAHSLKENTNVNDVDTLLSCINLWQKENKENSKLQKLDTFRNIPTIPFNSTNSLLKHDINKINGSINEGFMNLLALKPDLEEGKIAEEDLYKHSSGLYTNTLLNFDHKSIISNLNYPIDYYYDKLELAGENARDNASTNENSSDGTMGNEQSEFTSRLRTQTQNPNNPKLSENCEFSNANQFKSVAATESVKSNPKHVEYNSINTNSNTNYVNYKSANYENNSLQDQANVDDNYIDEFKGMIGKFINGENYHASNHLTNVPNRGFQHDNILTSDNVLIDRDFDEDLENEENPILSMWNRQDAIITERDILVYGKSDSNLELLTNSSNDNKTPQNNMDMIKDVSVNCQIDQILNIKEEPEPEKIRGVCFCKSDNSWTAWWTEKGKSRKKAFKLSLYGYEEARKKAIEHRLYIEEILPELKEKKFKTAKRKASTMSTPTTSINSVSTTNVTPRTDKDEAPAKEEGIFRGTRNRSREKNEENGVYFKDNVWYATWIDPFGLRKVNAFPVTKEVPFLAARNKAISAYNMNNFVTNAKNNPQNTYVQSNLNHQNFITPNNHFNNSDRVNSPTLNTMNNGTDRPNNYNGLNSNLIYEMSKRRKVNMDSSVGSKTDGCEYFKNMEKKIDGDLERGKARATQYSGTENEPATSTQTSQNPQIFLQNVQEYRLPESENVQQPPGTNKRAEAKLNSHHCQIKLERSILDEIEKAINKSLAQNSNQPSESQKINGNGNGSSENNIEKVNEEVQSPDNHRQEGDETLTNDQEEKSGKFFENVNALCISHAGLDKQFSVSIIPTYIQGPHQTQLLTFVILNS
ncbi:AP2 domain protein [Theileria parva strain Muguga]|uniref:AP2/ERF domain-containing protein n=1 Tax=Theileria parva TaxID=5875 RepID=Q4N9P6_THEPA|nr:AP2 domain protein [Theileria parva strain Muguga]EAN33312.1 AP2 domain protein [Theileria parva strain Muguga]|eukprot:XP_765595.1 hypothetical protein [Theileria parva strain Muguga]